MLVHTYNHLIPQDDTSPIAYSSSSSAYIPDISYDDLARSSEMPSYLAAHHTRHERRSARAAPYPSSISTNAASSFSSRFDPGVIHTPQPPILHSPRPVAYYNPVHALDRAGANMSSTMNHSACTGAHATILGDFVSQPEQAGAGTGYRELTATQMACMPVSSPANASLAAFAYPSPSEYDQSTPRAHSETSALPSPPFPHIQMPQVPHIPQFPQNLSHDFHMSPVDDLSNPPMLPTTISPASSGLHFHPPDKLPPPQNTFPTPSELLSELSSQDRDTQKDHRRAKRRKTHQDEMSKSLGYAPTDPDTISSHDKKRYYLDCLEQYVLYLHNQLRLVGVEPVPVERVSSGRGLTSRSIRTMIVHMQQSNAKLHRQKTEVEAKCNEMRAQFGADADQAAPLVTDGVSTNLGRRHTISYPGPGPQYTFP